MKTDNASIYLLSLLLLLVGSYGQNIEFKDPPPSKLDISHGDLVLEDTNEFGSVTRSIVPDYYNAESEDDWGPRFELRRKSRPDGVSDESEGPQLRIGEQFTRIFDQQPSDGSSNIPTSIRFQASVTSFIGIRQVALFVRARGENAFQGFQMNRSGDSYSLDVIAQAGVSYEWFIQATNRFNGKRNSNLLSFSVAGGSAPAAPAPPAPTPRPPAPAPAPGTALINNIQPSCFVVDQSRFNICLDLQLSNNNRLPAFQRAKDLWESVITGQSSITPNFGPFLRNNEPQGQIWANDVPNTLDDVYIAAFEVNIDGPGRVLGAAGPQYLNRNDLTLNGSMRFDRADVQNLLNTNPNYWLNVVTHEMAHVLGIGTLWRQNGLLRNGRYLGRNAQNEWQALGCTDSLPIETGGGPGTAFGHWDEDCLDSELMTGFLNSELANNPLSRITIASLQDIGYRVSYAPAQEYSTRNINTNICCFPRRQLRGEEKSEAPEEVLRRKARKLALSDRIVRIGARFARQELKRNREAAREIQADLPDGVYYVGGDFVSVLVLDEDDEIRDMTFSWDEVKNMDL